MTNNILAVVNQKGGVGKTTTAMNLATALAAIGRKVLLIDHDPQGNATTGFGISKEEGLTLYDVLLNKSSAEEAIQKTCVTNLNILPADINLSAIEIELFNKPNFRTILKEKLRDVRAKYDHIIIDCPPSLGVLTINALVAATSLLIPLQCEFFSLEGLKHLMDVIKMVKTSLNKDLKIQGVVLTMYDRRNNLTSLVEKDVRDCLGDLVYNTTIPRNVKLSEASSHGKPILVYDYTCAGATAYINLTREFLKREQTKELL